MTTEMRKWDGRPARRVLLGIAALSLTSLLACSESKPEGPAPSRFASVKKEASSKAATAFCEKQWPGAAGEASAKKYIEIPEKAVPGAPNVPAAPKGSWKWVNLWATWCVPCVEEMGLLAKWKSSLEKDGVPIDLELWSVDEEEAKLVEYMKKHSMPGRVRWLRAQDDLPGVLESLGADRMSAIPVHALVDGSGNLRCLRVGSVHDEDYGAVKTMLTGA